MNEERIALERVHDDERQKAKDEPRRATLEAIYELGSIGSLQAATDTGVTRAPSCSVGPRPWSRAKTAERPPERPPPPVPLVPRLAVTERVHARRAMIWKRLGHTPKTALDLLEEVGDDYIKACSSDPLARLSNDLRAMQDNGKAEKLGRAKGWVLKSKGSAGPSAGQGRA